MNWRALGERIGRGLAAGLEPLIGDRLRAHFTAKYGTCRSCGAPLGGPSPEQICVDCHANEALAAAFGGSGGGEA